MDALVKALASHKCEDAPLVVCEDATTILRGLDLENLHITDTL
jgi:hypothetical protein